MRVCQISLLIISLVLLASCSVDFSLLESRRCDNEGRCLAGYICDRKTMLCVKPNAVLDAGYMDITSDESVIVDIGIEDIESDISCVPTNNSVEICDDIDNNCNGQTDENNVCGSCTLTESITEACNENTNCNNCFIVNGVKYICVSKNGSDFSWTNESEIECNSSMDGKAIRCENLCFLCKDSKYGAPFFIQNESCDNKDNNCNGITDEGDICQTNMICVNGECVERPCQKNEDCPQGKICKNSICATCVDIKDDKLCGTGRVCVNGACIEGDCHQDSECGSGLCVFNKCCPDCCREKKDCPEEKVCKNNKCSECTDYWDDVTCGIGYICENKKCIKGNCHPSIGCLLSSKICVNYNCCEPGSTCCNEDRHCEENMTCTQSHTCECKPLFGDCNNRYSDGCEKNLSDDINNCGVCNQQCSLPNADPKCESGICKIKNCKSEYNNCDNNDSNGCESYSQTDILNCGSCGVECTNVNNATTKCENSKCTISSCNLGFADCNNKYDDGCEIDVNNDVDNCGGCGKKCPIGTTSCVDGICK